MEEFVSHIPFAFDHVLLWYAGFIHKQGQEQTIVASLNILSLSEKIMYTLREAEHVFWMLSLQAQGLNPKVKKGNVCKVPWLKL